jgi:hypothetical protein
MRRRTIAYRNTIAAALQRWWLRKGRDRRVESSANRDSRPASLSVLRNLGHPSNPEPSSSSSLVVSAASVSFSSSTFPRVSSLSPDLSKSTAFLCEG